MAVVPSKGNLPLCTTHPRYAKFNSSPRIQGTQGFFRLEANLICVLPTRQSVGSHTDGPICNPSHKSTSGICKLETKHRSGSDRHFLSRLDLSKGYAFHPFNLVSRCLIQVGEQNVHQLCIVTPIWETAMVSSSDGTEHRLPLPVSNGPTDSQQRGDSTPTPSSSTSRLACLSQRYSTFGVSAQAQNLLMSACSNQTSSYYESAWRLWCCWCYQQQIHPLLANIQHVVNFLAHQFEVGKEYYTINVYQSAISTTLPKVDDLNVGQHPLVCQTMKGIFQKKNTTFKILFFLGRIKVVRR